jgi:hypothetical protein
MSPLPLRAFVQKRHFLGACDTPADPACNVRHGSFWFPSKIQARSASEWIRAGQIHSLALRACIGFEICARSNISSDRRFLSLPSFSHLPCGRVVRKILTELVCADFVMRRCWSELWGRISSCYWQVTNLPHEIDGAEHVLLA